jgi:hypothetical protein
MAVAVGQAFGGAGAGIEAAADAWLAVALVRFGLHSQLPLSKFCLDTQAAQTVTVVMAQRFAVTTSTTGTLPRQPAPLWTVKPASRQFPQCSFILRKGPPRVTDGLSPKTTRATSTGMS